MFYTWNQSNMSQHDVLTEKKFGIMIAAGSQIRKRKTRENESRNSFERGDRTDFAQN